MSSTGNNILRNLSPGVHVIIIEVAQFEACNKQTAQTLVKIALLDIVIYAVTDVCVSFRIKRSAFLIIDDLGCEPVEVKNFGTSVTPITDIIYERYAAMKPTIITTNLDTRQIRTEYNERVADRLNEICRVIGYKNESYRK